MAAKTVLCVNTQSSYNTTLNPTGWCYEHRHDIFKFSNNSRTSTTYTEENDLYMVNDRANAKVPFLLTLTLLANTNVPAVAVF